jgi:acetyl-CoA acetyltransferase
MYDTTMGWRFINPKLDAQYGTDVMPKTAENLATEHRISREDQDRFAFWSQTKAAAAQADGRLAGEICPVEIPRRKQDPLIADRDEHPRETSPEKLAQLRPLFSDGTVTAGNASGINDGAAVVVLMTAEEAAKRGIKPMARIVSWAHAGVDPSIMGTGPIPA